MEDITSGSRARDVFGRQVLEGSRVGVVKVRRVEQDTRFFGCRPERILIAAFPNAFTIPEENAQPSRSQR